MHAVRNRSLCLLLVFAAGCTSLRTVDDEDGLEQLAARAKDRADSASESVEQARVAADIALKAVENAMAVQDEAEAGLINALGAGDPAGIDLAKGMLCAAEKDSKGAGAVAEDVVKYVRATATAAGLAGKEARRAAKTGSKREARAALKRAGLRTREAEQACSEASALACRLKVRWLIPEGVDTNGTARAATPGHRPLAVFLDGE